MTRSGIPTPGQWLGRMVVGGCLLSVMAGCATPAGTERAGSTPAAAGVRASPSAKSETGYTFLDRDASERITRWDPCGIVYYVVDPQGAPAGGVNDVRAAVAQVSAATGIRFAFDGFVSERPSLRRAELQRRPPAPGRNPFQPVLIGWYSRGEAPPNSEDDVIGYAAPISEYDGTQRVYISGLIGIRGDAGLPAGFDGSQSVGGVLLHELGHLMGLGHSPDRKQIMYREAGHLSGPARYRPADLAGLRELGRTKGCLTSQLWARNR